ncbi:MAG: NADPH-dependent 7-cyano-7-deazaguanine reductase QueF [Paludibacter sp.]|nr:NADPH-dependent 7-cyano-7-deazaguanine reductase QueF [Paludibacter sp.]
MQFDLNNSILGKQASNPERYDASFLFRIPRSENRVHYEIDNSCLPFVGFDVWNCYEVSFLTDNGLPVSRVLKLIYPAESEFLVESKSLKLYLNSFNMDRFGETVIDAEMNVLTLISKDLNALLETEVHAVFFNENSQVNQPFPSFYQINLSDLVPAEKLELIEFSRFKESPELLRSKITETIHNYVFHTDMLRSNCRVTNQPDWGDLFVQITTKHDIDLSSVIEYLVSFRQENHFHEEVVEMIYKRFQDAFKPQKLMVAAMYTRRGGIDINPIRASHFEMIDASMISTTCRMAKTLRQ